MIYNNINRLLEPRSMIRMNFWKTTHLLSPKNTEEHEGPSQLCQRARDATHYLKHSETSHIAVTARPSHLSEPIWTTDLLYAKRNIARAYGYGKQIAGRLVVQGPRRIGENQTRAKTTTPRANKRSSMIHTAKTKNQKSIANKLGKSPSVQNVTIFSDNQQFHCCWGFVLSSEAGCA